MGLVRSIFHQLLVLLCRERVSPCHPSSPPQPLLPHPPSTIPLIIWLISSFGLLPDHSPPPGSAHGVSPRPHSQTGFFLSRCLWTSLYRHITNAFLPLPPTHTLLAIHLNMSLSKKCRSNSGSNVCCLTVH